MIKLFVDENKENLSKLADQKINLDYFRKHMVIFDHNGNFIYPDLENYSYYDDIKKYDDLIIVIDKDTKLFNVLDEYKSILYDIWFDKISNKTYKDRYNKEYLKGFKNDDVYYLYLNGTYKKLNF